jgi:hypothetical protein
MATDRATRKLYQQEAEREAAKPVNCQTAALMSTATSGTTVPVAGFSDITEERLPCQTRFSTRSNESAI